MSGDGRSGLQPLKRQDAASTLPPQYDVIVVGGGPAGAVCGAHCAAGGLRTLILERAVFPREKVCGDCLNPGCWPILRRLELVERVLELPHARLEAVEFLDRHGRRLSVGLGKGELGEIAIKRSYFDHLLLTRAGELGAEVVLQATVIGIERAEAEGRWSVKVEGGGNFSARWLAAADGRNSTVARLSNLLPPARKDRLGQQTHFPLPAGMERRVAMRFLHEGYSGLADVGGGEANLCLVSEAKAMPRLKAWAHAHFALPAGQPWRSIAPLERAPAEAYREGLFLTGDAARVVEPFTGEGIYYAMASGELAAEAILTGTPELYAARHRRLYRGRVWVNRLARAACLNPGLTSAVLACARRFPAVLRLLTSKVTRGGSASSPSL